MDSSGGAPGTDLLAPRRYLRYRQRQHRRSQSGFGTRLEKIQKQPDEIRRLVRATLRGIQYAKNNEPESIRSIMKWTDMDQGLAEGSYEMASSSWSATGVASAQGLQIAMEEIHAELKLEAAPDPFRAFDWSFVQK